MSGKKTLYSHLYLENWLLPAFCHPVLAEFPVDHDTKPDELGLLDSPLPSTPKGTPIPHKGIEYKSEEQCNGVEASRIFDGVREHEGNFVWDCQTSVRLCECLVFIGETGKMVEFVSESPAETLKLHGDRESVTSRKRGMRNVLCYIKKGGRGTWSILLEAL